MSERIETYQIVLSVMFCFNLIGGFNALADPSPYGDIYLQDQKQLSERKWQAALRYHYELGNPYFQLHSLGLGVTRYVSEFVGVGAKASITRGSATQLNNTLSAEFAQNGVIESMRKPELSVFAVATILPFYGQVNFFGGNPVQLELAIDFGAGAIQNTSASAFGVHWAFLPRAYFSEHFGLELGISQDIESPFDSATRAFHLNTTLGLIYH